MIIVNNISKNYGNVKAVKNVSFSIDEGELFGVIGPDGAGKSTLFRTIISLLVADSGDIRLWDLDPVKDYKEIRKIVGYMPGKFSLYEDLSIEENLTFFASVFGTTIQENYYLIEDIYQQIEPFKDRLAGNLSGGMKQKLALSCALIHKPKLLVLDEPTTGIDAVSRSELWEMLKRLKSFGITILVSTPYMDEAAMCDRVALMQDGEIFNVANPQEIVDNFDGEIFGAKSSDMYSLVNDCRNFEKINNVFLFGEELHLTFKDGKNYSSEIKEFLTVCGQKEFEIYPIKPNIEDQFMALMSKK